MYKEFIYKGSRFEKDWRQWLEATNRWSTMKAALNIAFQNHKEHFPFLDLGILETGCVRTKDDVGSGYSTIIFADALKYYDGAADLISVDNNLDHLGACGKILAEIWEKTLITSVSLVHADSVKYLSDLAIAQDLIYLDSFDANENDEEETKLSQEHQLKEVIEADSVLRHGGVILLDDNDLPYGGKTAKSKEWLASEGSGYKCILDEYQSVWQKYVNG